jgi:hypothetical protein
MRASRASGIRGADPAGPRGEVAMVEDVAHAAQEGLEPVEDRKAFARRRDDQRIAPEPCRFETRTAGLPDARWPVRR